MKGEYHGVMTVDEFYQASRQDRVFFDQFKITHFRAAYWYFTPCNHNGVVTVPCDAEGNPLAGYISAGSYRPAAEKYDPIRLEPVPVPRHFIPVLGAGRRG
jgi:hypothetical protein